MSAPRPRPEILEISPYVGGESKLAGANRTIKLSSNEGAFGVPPAAQAAYVAMARELHRYPDGSAIELRRAIGAKFHLDPERIVCGAGSDDLLYQLCLAYGGPGTEIIMSEHGFSIYQIAGTYSGAKVLKTPERNLTADVDAMLAAVSPATRIVFLANPNNPTGSTLPHDEVVRLRDALPPHVLLVLDAAYAEYVDRADYDAGVKLVDAGDNTVMTRTFSKIFGLGGMRIGWAYAPPAVIDVLNRVRGPFNVSVAAQAAGIAALGEPGWMEKSARAQRRVPRHPDGAAAPGRAENLAERRQFRARRFRHARARRRRQRLLPFPRHHRARGARLRPAALPAHHHRHRRGGRPGRRRHGCVHGHAVLEDPQRRSIRCLSLSSSASLWSASA